MTAKRCCNRTVIVLLALLGWLLQPVLAAEAEQRWAASWGASPFTFFSFLGAVGPVTVKNQTLRQQLRLSVGGNQLRVRLSNELGKTPLLIGAATVALAADGAGIQPDSLHKLTFGGATSVSIPAGAPLLSDPIDMPVAALAELAVSLYLPEAVEPLTTHVGRTAWLSGEGDFTAATSIDGATLSTNMLFLTGVHVRTVKPVSVLVAFGDSITDGTASTPHAYASWPDQFAARVATDDAGRAIAVVNAGISGNQILLDGAGVSALARFDRDVLAVPGVTHVVVLEGINDIGIGGLGFPGAPPQPLRSAAELIAGYRQLIARAHANGLQIFGATLLPFAGVQGGYYTPEKELVRQEVNRWIRESGEYDGVIDFEAAVRDDASPPALQPQYDSGDHLHPGDEGYRRMADSVSPALFR